MKTDLKNLLLISSAALIILGFSVFGLFLPDARYSASERRALAQMPTLSLENLSDGSFMADFEAYTPDQFPMRDALRTLKAVTSLHVFLQKDNHGIYTADGYISKLEYPKNDAMLQNAAEKMTAIYDRYLAESDCKVYLSVIPDKNYFLADRGGYPVMDYAGLVETVRAGTGFASYIDVFGDLSLADYYRTDTHLRQERITDAAKTLAEGMNALRSDEFTERIADAPLYGVYLGQSALPFLPDEMRYLTSDLLSTCTVTSYNAGIPEPAPLYDMEKAAGRDAYEMFLGGADPLIVIENPSVDTDRKLVLFRDSFGSSIAPLLVSGYKTVTLVDLRYLPGDKVGDFVTFTDQDVLFLYSTLILNNSSVLR